MDVLIYRRKGARMPTRGSEEAAGYDLYALLPDGDAKLYPLRVNKIPTGIFIAQHPLGVCLACCRSGLAAKGVHIVNSPGIIDSDYRGELFMLLTYIAPPDTEPFIIKDGDRIGQLLFFNPGKVDMGTTFVECADEVIFRATRSTRRGTDGFGSTGR